MLRKYNFVSFNSGAYDYNETMSVNIHIVFVLAAYHYLPDASEVNIFEF